MSDNSWLYKHLDSSHVELKLNLSDLNPKNDSDCTFLKNFQIVGSYSWCPDSSTKEKPIIIVPGKPSYLKKTLKLERLSRIKYTYISDVNSSNFPEYPIEPIYRSVLECTPDFDFKTVDIIAERSVLRQLNSAIDGAESGDSSLRIDFQRIGNSVVLFRCDKNAKEYYEDFRQDFEAKMANNKQKGDFTRVVSYQIGSLKILQRFEANYLEPADTAATEDETDRLASSLGHVDINNNPTIQLFEHSNLGFIRDGSFLQLQNTVELATKATASYSFNFPDSKWNMLFFTNGNRLVIGWHKKGMLEKIENLDYSELSKRSNRSKLSIQSSISRLVDLLERLKAFVMRHEPDGTRYSLIFEKIRGDKGSFTVYKRAEKFECLPKELIKEIF